MKQFRQNKIPYYKELDKRVDDEIRKNNILKLREDNKYKNLLNQIFKLQLKQFADSITSVKKDIKRNKYLIEFDPIDGIDVLILDENDYRDFIKYREPSNHISLYDLKQEKIYVYNTTVETSPNLGIKRGRTKKNIDNKPIDKDNNSYEIAKEVTINYQMCHHCKLRKPVEVLAKCNSNKINEKTPKCLYINNCTIVKGDKNFVITDYSSDPKEILNGYMSKSSKYQKCNLFYCNYCLKSSYDQSFETIIKQKEWNCPSCIVINIYNFRDIVSALAV